MYHFDEAFYKWKQQKRNILKKKIESFEIKKIEKNQNFFINSEKIEKNHILDNIFKKNINYIFIKGKKTKSEQIYKNVFKILKYNSNLLPKELISLKSILPSNIFLKSIFLSYPFGNVDPKDKVGLVWKYNFNLKFLLKKIFNRNVRKIKKDNYLNNLRNIYQSYFFKGNFILEKHKIYTELCTNFKIRKNKKIKNNSELYWHFRW